MMPHRITPMMQQYLSIKADYPDALLFYRMGDFYEMFFEDAEEASRVLEITLTSRNKNEEKPIPMCGVPVKAAAGYISRLINNGFKVAVCEQIEDHGNTKGLVKREVVRVITPGMVIDEEFLDKKSNNFVLSLFCLKNTWGISYLDLSTGTFRVSESVDQDSVYDEVLRILPMEMVFPKSAEDSMAYDLYGRLRAFLREKAVTFIEENNFELNSARQRLIDHFKTLSLEGFGCGDLTAGICAAGALFSYVQDTQKREIRHFDRIEPYSLKNHLLVDDQSRKNLELERNLRFGTRKGTLISVLDRTVTSMGGRLLGQWLRYPLTDKAGIMARLGAVEEMLKKRRAREEIRELLRSVYDLERLNGKVAMGQANARDLVALKDSLKQLPGILHSLSDLKNPFFTPGLQIDELAMTAEKIEAAVRDDPPPTIQEGGMIREGYDERLDELLKISRDGKGFLAGMEARQRAETGIASLKVGFNRVFGYYIEVPKGQVSLVPPHYIRRQTLVNAERYITDELKQYEDKILHAEERIRAIEYEIFKDVCKAVVARANLIREAAGFISRLDVICTLAEVAEKNDYIMPEITGDGVIEIEDGRHPVVEKMLSGERFVPNTIRLDDQREQILLITGPNMAGKSTILRQVALTVIMAQMGSFVPARSARISVVDRIFTRVGALDNLSQGQSTFLVEMQETANILHNSTPQSLVILDEIGRGTSTFDGLSIAWAVAEYLHDLKGKGVKTLFATHYHELTALARQKRRVANHHILVKEVGGRVIFLRKLKKGATDKSYGIEVARLAGIPEDVVKRAGQVLEDIEAGKGPSADLSARKKPLACGQLTLFESEKEDLVKTLQSVDLLNMTPIEAMNLLYRLQKKAAVLPG